MIVSVLLGPDSLVCLLYVDRSVRIPESHGLYWEETAKYDRYTVIP